MKMKLSAYFLASVMIMTLLLVEHVPVAMSATCNASQLSPCAAAMLTGAQPSSACCQKLKEQQPCLCQYLNDPNLQRFLNPANSRKVSSACKVPYPSC